MKEFVRTLLLTMIVCCWSCSDGGEDLPTPSPKPETSKIEISSSVPVVEQKGGTATITFTTNAAWTASIGSSTSWAKVSPASGTAGTHTLYVTTEANDTFDERNATLTIKAGNTSRSVTITQKQKDALTVTSNKVEVNSDGGDFSIEAKANVSVSYEIEESAKDWISAIESRALTTTTLHFTAKANDKVERRQGNIIVKGGDGLTETVTVYQSGEEVSLVLTTPKDMTIGSEGGTLKIELESNTEIRMEELDSDWLRQSSSRAMSAYTYYIEVDANETYDERNASITFTSGDKKQIVTITQKQKDALIVTSNKVEIGSNGGDFSIEAKANVSVSYEIEESAKDWISAIESRALTTTTLHFTAKANDKVERRQGNIIVKGGDGLTETVTVYQEGEKATLVITSDDIVVGSNGETIKIELKSNVDYTMTLPKVNWISKEESRAISAYTHYFAIAPNETYDQRNAVVYFQNETEGLKDSISITQLQKDAIIVAKNEYEVAPETGKLEFIINTNVDFEVSVSVDWIKQNTDSRGLMEKQLSFEIGENEDKEPRKGEIVIVFEDLKQTIKVTQKGAIDYEAIERAALIEFFEAAGGNDWIDKTNWCSDKPLSEWYGIELNEKGRVKGITLSSNNLIGIISESIGNLTELERLLLDHNQLSGNIPESIGNLTELYVLFLTRNQLSGNIPEGIGNLTELGLTYLDHNQLSGNIPESIGNLTKSKFLCLNDNQLSGNVPESIGNLKELKNLNLSENQLSGNIAHITSTLTKLGLLALSDNCFTGDLPEFSEMIGQYLVHNNLFTGSIPISHIKAYEKKANDDSFNNTDYGCIYSIYGNNLSGEIPSAIVNHKNWVAHWREVMPQNRGYGFNRVDLPAPQIVVKCFDGHFLDLSEEYRKNQYTIIFRWDPYCPWSHLYVQPIYQLYQKYKNKGLGLVSTTLSKYSMEAMNPLTSVFKDIKVFWESGASHDSWDNNPMGLGSYFFLFRTGSTPYFHVVDNSGNIVFYGSGEGGAECIPQYHENRDDIYDFVANLFGDEKYEETIYTSTDYSRDGEVVTLQKASVGKGINLTFMGEAFVDKDMGDGGLYEQKMQEAMEKFFSIEPYKSMRNRFNVYAVKVISPNAEFSENAEHRINENNDICFEYAQKIPNADKNPPMISVVYNTTFATGRSYTTMFSDGAFVGYMMDGISNVLVHEIGGHGFANLLDEYVEGGLENSTLPEDYQTYMDNVWETFGWGANVDWRNNASTVKWSHFLNDARYADDGLGLYEGAYLYGHGAYRPTENSMMRYNDSPFNAPSREQIYKRIMQRSEGEGWKYDYEEFVKYDEINRNTTSRSAIKPLTEDERRKYIKNHRPPTLIKSTWRDAMKGKSQILVPLR